MPDSVTKIGKYQILEQVGEGAMGVVYKATDPVLNRPVAIKVMSEGMAQDAALRERFLREAQAAGSLQHPNVVTIYDFGETDGHLFIAMEFIEGTDLEQLLKRNAPIPLPGKLDIMVDVLNGLSYAHRRGIVHRDIKPANIRIDEEGHARIMDFGVAHLATSNLTGTGVMMGTPNYMAPENITGGEVTPASDLFSVGAVMYELLTNTKPFAADTLHRVLFRIVSDPPPDLLEVDPTLPAALGRIITKALAKEVGDRYANATEMANDLSAVRASIGAPRASRTVSQRSSIEKSLLSHKSSNTRTLRRWQITSGVAATLVVVVLGAVAIDRSDRPASPRPASGASVTVAGTPATDSLRLPRLAVDSIQAPPPPPASNPAPVRQPEPLPRAAAPARETKTTPPRRDTTRTVVANSTPQQTSLQSVVPRTEPAVTAPVVAPPIAPPQEIVTAPVTSAPVDTSASRPSAPAPAEHPRVAITSVITAYARAIGTRDVAEVKRVYPTMTPAQQSGWESFFGSVRSMSAAFDITSLDVSGGAAVAKLSGVYEFTNRAGRQERQPASFEATFQRDGERWVLRRVR